MPATCRRYTVWILSLLSGWFLTSCGVGTLAVAVGLSDDEGTTTVERAPTSLAVVTPEGGQSGRVAALLKITLDPKESVRLTSVEYSLSGSDGEFHPATPALGFPTELATGETISGGALAARTNPFLRFVWNSHHDLDELRRASGSPATLIPITARAVLRFRITNLNVDREFEAETEEFFLHNGLTDTIAGGGVGDGFSPAEASLLAPAAIATTLAGDLLIADTGNHRLRQVELEANGAVSIETLAGNGFRGIDPNIQPARRTSLDTPLSVAVRQGETVFVVERDEQGVVFLRALDLASGLIAPLLPGTMPGLRAVGYHGENSLLLLDAVEGILTRMDLEGVNSFPLTLDFSDARLTPGFTFPVALAVAPDPETEVAYVAELVGASAARVQEVVDGTVVRVVAGGGGVDPLDLTPEEIQASPPLATELSLAAVDALAADDSLFYLCDRTAGYVAVVNRASLRLVNVIPGLVHPVGLSADAQSRLLVLEGGDSSPGSDGSGHQVMLVADPSSPLDPGLEPLVAHASGKDSADELGGAGAIFSEGEISQSPT